MRDADVYRSSSSDWLTPIKATLARPLRLGRMRQLNIDAGNGKKVTQYRVTGTPSKAYKESKDIATTYYDKEALTLKDWLDAHLALKRHLRHVIRRNEFNFKDSSDLEHSNMFRFLSREYVQRYAKDYDIFLRCYLTNQARPRYCLVQTPGSCVLFSILNLYSLVYNLDETLPSEHMFAKRLCEAFHPFRVSLQAPEEKEILTADAMEKLKTAEEKNGTFNEDLFQHHFATTAGTTEETQNFQENSKQVLHEYQKLRSKELTDEEKEFDSLNFGIMVFILLGKKVHTVRPEKFPIQIREDLKIDIQTLETFLVTLLSQEKDTYGCILVEADVQIYDENGEVKKKVEESTIREEREKRFTTDGQTSAEDRHAITYHKQGRNVYVYDSWDGTISELRRSRGTLSGDWKGLGKPKTWIVFAYVQL